MPCESLVIVYPTMGEVDMMTDTTKRQVLSNNMVIEVACERKKDARTA